MPCYLTNSTLQVKLFKSWIEDPDDFKNLKNKFEEEKIIHMKHYLNHINNNIDYPTNHIEDYYSIVDEYNYYCGDKRISYLEFLINETINEMKNKHIFMKYFISIKNMETNKILVNHDKPYIPYNDIKSNIIGVCKTYDVQYLEKIEISISFI